MFLEVLSKLASESLLSLYPIFVKNINLPIIVQLWSRFLSFIFISSFFINYGYIFNNLLSKDGVILSFITLIHVATSYLGFHILESGIAYSIFYFYPLLIPLIAYGTFNYFMIFQILGVFMLSYESKNSNSKTEKTETKDDKEDQNIYFGIFMIILAGITEALIYFSVRKLKTNNNWNHIFISYFFGAILLTFLNLKDIYEIKLESNLSLSLVINIVIGLFGYLLRFFAISNLEPYIYAPLTYFGIVMAYIYGIIFNNDSLSFNKIIGTLLIIIPNFFIIHP